MKEEKGFFSQLFGKKQDNISANDGSESLASPLSGEIIAIEDVADETFSQKILGDGIAIEPDTGKVFAPTVGEVSALMDTNHAVCITSEMGAEILIHVGQDTVSLGGEGFNVFVKEGDKVKKGQLLLEFDIAMLKQKNITLTTPIVISNCDDFVMEKTSAKAVAVGDNIITLRKK